MRGKTVLAAVLLAVCVGLSGCAACHHKACHWSPFPNVDPEACACQRNRVHVFLVGGVDLFDDGGLRGLRDAVNAAGFPQVYYGHTHHRGWFGREMRRIACDDPEARFILVGYGVGAGDVVKLDAEACRHGLHAEGVILLDPAGVPTDDAHIGADVRVIASERWTPRGSLPGWEVVRLPGVCHYSVATDPYTVEQTLRLVRDAVGRVPPEVHAIPVMPLIDDPAPLPEVIPGPPAQAPAGVLTARPATR